MNQNLSERVNILGSNISVFDCAETADIILHYSSQNHTIQHAQYICVSNVHTVTTGLEDLEYQKITNESFLSTADGVPLIWASKILNGSTIHGRASGPDILELLVSDSKYSNLSHYFYGGSPSTISLLKENLLKLNSNLKIAGMVSPPIRPAQTIYTELSSDEKSDLDTINTTNADVIWIGLGAPKQEIFMYRSHKYLKKGLMLGVGAAFDFLSGNKKRAPLWMQKTGLEWSHRLLSEPGRLASRYLSTNPKFVAAVLKQAITQKIR